MRRFKSQATLETVSLEVLKPGLFLQHGYFFIQDRPPGRLGSGQPGQAEPAEPQVRNPILTSSIEMLMGTGGGASNRGEARLANWSDDGLPPVGFSSEAPGLVAGESPSDMKDRCFGWLA